MIIKYVVSVVFYIPAPHRPIDHGRAATARGVLVIESMGNKGVINADERHFGSDGKGGVSCRVE